MRVLGITLVIGAILVMPGPAAAGPALPAPDGSKHCGIVAKGRAEYRVKARVVSCRFARRWVKRYFRSRRVAPGFTFTETSGGKAPWYCTRGSRKAYWPERL